MLNTTFNVKNKIFKEQAFYVNVWYGVVIIRRNKTTLLNVFQNFRLHKHIQRF